MYNYNYSIEIQTCHVQHLEIAMQGSTDIETKQSFPHE